MLKWFRKYNKFILVAGACVLMVAFLVPQALISGGGGGRQGELELGRIGDQVITSADLRQANAEAQVLERLGMSFDRPLSEDPLSYLLMLREARDNMGIRASDFELAQFLDALNLNDAELAQLAGQLGTSVEAVRHTLRNGLILNRYYQHMLMASTTLTEPALRRLLYDTQANARIAALRVSSASYEPQEPPAPLVRKLFNEYRDVLPGEGEPYPFGYKRPNQVKLEYLQVPFDALEAAVSVDETEIRRYYEENRERLYREEAEDADAPATYTAYTEARSEIRGLLRRNKAEALGDEVIREAQNILSRDERGLLDAVSGDDRGYKIVPDDFTPTSLEDVANALETEFADRGLERPQVHIRENQWLTMDDVAAIEGLGEATVRFGVASGSLVDYLLSLKELATPEDNVFVGQKLQVGLASRMVVGADGTRYLVRVTDALPARVPEALVEVKDRVEADAIRLAGYQALLEKQDELLGEARQGMGELSGRLGVDPLLPEPFPRRLLGFTSLVAPEVDPQIDADEAFVDAVFTMVQKVLEHNALEDPKYSDLRFTAVPDPSKLCLWVVRLQGFEPPTQASVNQSLMFIRGNPQVQQMLSRAITRPQVVLESLTLDALKKRVGYVEIEEEG